MEGMHPAPKKKPNKWKGSLRKGFEELKCAFKAISENKVTPDDNKNGIRVEQKAPTSPSLPPPNPRSPTIPTQEAHSTWQSIDEALSDPTSTDPKKTTSSALTSTESQTKPPTSHRLPLRNLYRDGAKRFGFKDPGNDQRSMVNPPIDQSIVRFKVKMARSLTGSSPEKDSMTRRCASVTDKEGNSTSNDFRTKTKAVRLSGGIDGDAASDSVEEGSRDTELNIRAQCSSEEVEANTPTTGALRLTNPVLKMERNSVTAIKLSEDQNGLDPVTKPKLSFDYFPMADDRTAPASGTETGSTVTPSNHADNLLQQNSIYPPYPEGGCNSMAQYITAVKPGQETQAKTQTGATVTNLSQDSVLIDKKATEYSGSCKRDGTEMIKQKSAPVKQIEISSMSQCPAGT